MLTFKSISFFVFTLNFTWSSVGCSCSSISLILLTMGAWECLRAERFLLASSFSLFTLSISLRVVSYSWEKENGRTLFHLACQQPLQHSSWPYSPPMVSSFPAVRSCPDVSSFRSNGSHRVCSSRSSVWLSQGSSLSLSQRSGEKSTNDN